MLLTVRQLAEKLEMSIESVNSHIKKNNIQPTQIEHIGRNKCRLFDYEQFVKTLSNKTKSNLDQLNQERQEIYTKGFLNVKDPIFRRRTQCQRRAAIDAIERMGGVSRHW